MAWFRIDDGFADHPKVIRAGNAAVGLWVRCGAYSSRYLTEGHVAPELVNTYAGNRREVDRLIDTRLWIPNGDGFVIPDFLEFNPSAEQVLAERAAARERQRRARDASKRRRAHVE